MPHLTTLNTLHGALALPVFLPDATRAVVRSLGSEDIEAAGIRAIMVNALHLAHRPGATVVEAHGGVHRFMGWTKPAFSDSGGYQAYSLTKDKALGSVNNEGFHYRFAKGDDKKLLDPARCMAMQVSVGADVIMCLDQCTHPGGSKEDQLLSVKRTIRWSLACRDELKKEADKAKRKPLLFAIIQGGNDPELRRRCAGELANAGFDGFGYGGWPVGEDGKLIDAVALTASLLPDDSPKLALGIGKPENIVDCYRAGYGIFDCTLPTRDARHGRLYTFKRPVKSGERLEPDFCERLDLGNERHLRVDRPIETGCDCPVCARYSIGYLHHLYKVQDATAGRLATIHNLRFYSRLFELLPNLPAA